MLHSDLPLVPRAVWQCKALAIVSLLLLAACNGSSGEPTDFDPVDAWATHEGFAVEVDAHGFTLPTAIAFVPQPGADPGDPLYFVAELRGTIKVVTNDRQVLTFAEVETVQPDGELPEREAETGLAGLCLAPEEGYVFVTFTEVDEIGIIRNRILRFEGTPQTLGRSPTGATEIAPEVGAEPSSFSHQIGNCWVAGDALYIGVGEGFNSAAARARAAARQGASPDTRRPSASREPVRRRFARQRAVCLGDRFPQPVRYRSRGR